MPQNNNMNSITPTALTDAIAKATNGRVATKWSYGGGIVSYGEILDAVSKGVIDIGPMYIGYKPAVFRMTAALSTFLDLSMAYGKFTALDSWRLTNQLWKEFPEFDQEFTKFNVKVLLPIPADDYMMLTSKPVSKFEDLKGLKLRAPGEYLAKLFGPAGATPVTVAFADVYTSLQTKLIDGVYSNIDSMDASKFYEPAPYASHLGSHIVLAVTYVSMNLDTWKKISPADQKAILDAAAALPGDGQDKKSAQVIAKWKADPKVTTTFWPQSEIDKWVKVSPDWYALLAADLNKAGLPGTKVTTRMKELVTQYMAEKK